MLGRTTALFLVLGGSSLSLAQEQVRGDTPTDLRIVSILTQAKDIAETAATEKERAALRRRVAQFIENTGKAAAFGSYVESVLGSRETRAQEYYRERPVETRNLKRYVDAKLAFLNGDSARAREILRGCERTAPLSCFNEPWLESYFVTWDLEAGKLVDVLQRLRTTNWASNDFKASIAKRIAHAYAAAGRRAEAVAILLDRELAPAPEHAFAEDLWKFGEREVGIRLQRHAVAEALIAARQDVKKRLPVELAGVQIAMGDNEGAIKTLRALLRLAVPLEYDLPLPRPSDVPVESWDPRAKLTPAADRWIIDRALLVETLAWAGLNSDAFAMLGEPPVDDALVLRNIVIGQAKRGDFESAFKTLELIRTKELRIAQTWWRPLPDALKLTGANSYELRESPLDPLDENRKAWSFFVGASAIAKHAARSGNENVFTRACAANQQVNHRSRNACPAGVLRHLAKAGHVEAAVEFALASQDPSARVMGLGFIAEGIAGIPDPLDNRPLRP